MKQPGNPEQIQHFHGVKMPQSKIKSLFAALLAAGFCLTLSAAESEVDSVLAAVNGEPITLGELLPMVREREFQLKNAYSGDALEKEILKIRFQAVEEIINRKLIEADFHNKNLVLVSQDIENELDRWGEHIGCPSRKDLEEKIKNSGTTLQKMRERAAQRMMVQIMRRREFALADSPSPSEIFQRFKQEEKSLSFPGSVELALLKLPLSDKKNAKEIEGSLKKDPSLWNQFAAQFALTPGSDGRIGSVDLDKLRPEFAKVMTKITPGAIYSSVNTADGIYFIKVLKFSPPRKAVFKEHAETLRKKMEAGPLVSSIIAIGRPSFSRTLFTRFILSR